MDGREKRQVWRIPIIVIIIIIVITIIIIIITVTTAEVSTRFWWEDLGIDVKVKLTLQQVTKTRKGSRGIALLFP